MHVRLYPHVNAGFAKLDAMDLKHFYGAGTAEELRTVLASLLQGAGSTGTVDRWGRQPMAWDLARCAQVARLGFSSEHFNEPETWEWLLQAEHVARQCYRSWDEYGASLLDGRRSWLEANGRGRMIVSIEKTERALADLADPFMADNPWHLAPW